MVLLVLRSVPDDIGVGIGMINLGFSYIYDWMKNKEEDIVKMNKRLDSFTEWWTRQEIK